MIRGESHSGNLSAAALAELGPVGRAGVGLPAVRAARRGVHAGPSRARPAAGGDWSCDVGGGRSGRPVRRGKLTPGLRGDLTLVDDSASWPVVRATFRAAQPIRARAGARPARDKAVKVGRFVGPCPFWGAALNEKDSGGRKDFVRR